MENPVSLPLLPSRPSCSACELREGVGEGGHVGVPTVWDNRSLEPGEEVDCVVFLGQNPGYHENRRNEPFVGPSGAIVRGSYSPRLLRLASVYYSNTARCYTPSEQPPKSKQYSACVTHTVGDMIEIAGVHRRGIRCVVCLGLPATTTLRKVLGVKKSTGLSEAFKDQGRSVRVGKEDWLLFSAFHPAAVMRKRNLIYAVEDHLALVERVLTGESPMPSVPEVVEVRRPRTGEQE